MSGEQAGNTVSLGCGTLILIAVIVSFFSNGNSELEHDIRKLRSEITSLRQEVTQIRVLLEQRAALRPEAE